MRKSKYSNAQHDLTFSEIRRIARLSGTKVYACTKITDNDVIYVQCIKSHFLEQIEKWGKDEISNTVSFNYGNLYIN
jgi:hypothetical protein